MWTYEQRTGELFDAAGERVGVGYSGFGIGKNNPALQRQPNVGPLPCGLYTIEPPIDVHGGPHGPYVLPLTPDTGNEMFGRSEFLMHGDSIGHPGEASHGCVIQLIGVRMRVAKSGDNRLKVEEGAASLPGLQR